MTSAPLTGLSIGEYQVLELLGRGGMGEVYEGLQPVIGKRVAIKVLLEKAAQKLNGAERFLAEARTVNAIGHRGIVDIFSFGSLPDGRHYFVMELLKGEPLNTYLTAHSPLPVVEVAQLLEELLDALDAVHRAGVIHRDLKPSNLFLARQPNGTRYLKVLDFGIAKVEFRGRTQTMPNLVLGTLQYMAPEQTRGNVSPAIDLWAAGCIAWRMLAGRVPYPIGPEAGELHRRPPPLEEVRAGVPPALEELILKLMAKEPADRPPAAEACEALRTIRESLTQVVKLWPERATDVDVSTVRPEEVIALSEVPTTDSHSAPAEELHHRATKLLPNFRGGSATPKTDQHEVLGRSRWVGWAVAVGLLASVGLLVLVVSRFEPARPPAPIAPAPAPVAVEPAAPAPAPVAVEPAAPAPVASAPPALPAAQAPTTLQLAERIRGLRAKTRNKAALILLEEEEASLRAAASVGQLRALELYLDAWELKYAPR